MIKIFGTHEKQAIDQMESVNCLSEPKVDRVAHEEWIKDVAIELRGGDLDESPYCYKRIEEVLEAHSNTIDILHTLRPLGVCMASSKEYDPYKD